MSAGWKSIEFIHSGDLFLERTLHLINHAQRSIDLESYIFMADEMGKLVLEALSIAKKRGVQVRILIDGVGSGPHLKAIRDKAHLLDLEVKVFNPLPAVFVLGLFQTDLSNRKEMAQMLTSGFAKTISRLNRRNHRKSTIVDNEKAIIGGINITDVTLEKVHGSKAWRDTSVLIESPEISEISEAFRHAWTQSPFLTSPGASQRAPKKIKFPSQNGSDGNIFLNDRPSLRKTYHKEFFHRIRSAHHRIYLVTPYFVPTRRLLKELAHAAARGVQVQIILPERSDVRILDFLKDPYIRFLCSKGVHIYQYPGRILHAKYAIIDNLASVGSGNLNHRSLLHDLEVEATFPIGQGLEDLERQWLIDLENSEETPLHRIIHRSFLKRIVAEFIFWFRYYL